MDLSTQVQEHKDLMSINRTEKEYQALIEQLNDTITSLENRILKIEDSTIVDENSKEKRYLREIEEKVKYQMH